MPHPDYANVPGNADYDPTLDENWHRPGSPDQAAALKKMALTKLHTAVEVLSSARKTLCNLEGEGYCEAYESILPIMDDLIAKRKRLLDLQPPTGVFII